MTVKLEGLLTDLRVTNGNQSLHGQVKRQLFVGGRLVDYIMWNTTTFLWHFCSKQSVIPTHSRVLTNECVIHVESNILDPVHAHAPVHKDPDITKFSSYSEIYNIILEGLLPHAYALCSKGVYTGRGWVLSKCCGKVWWVRLSNCNNYCPWYCLLSPPGVSLPLEWLILRYSQYHHHITLQSCFNRSHRVTQSVAVHSYSWTGAICQRKCQGMRFK